MGDDSGSSKYRDGCPAGVVGKVVVGLFIAFAWIVNGGSLKLRPGDPGYQANK